MHKSLSLDEVIDALDHTLAHAAETPELVELTNLITSFVNGCEEAGVLERKECFIF